MKNLCRREFTLLQQIALLSITERPGNALPRWIAEVPSFILVLNEVTDHVNHVLPVYRALQCFCKFAAPMRPSLCWRESYRYRLQCLCCHLTKGSCEQTGAPWVGVAILNDTVMSAPAFVRLPQVGHHDKAIVVVLFLLLLSVDWQYQKLVTTYRLLSMCNSIQTTPDMGSIPLASARANYSKFSEHAVHFWIFLQYGGGRFNEEMFTCFILRDLILPRVAELRSNLQLQQESFWCDVLTLVVRTRLCSVWICLVWLLWNFRYNC